MEKDLNRSQIAALKVYPPTHSEGKRHAKRVQSESVDTHQPVRTIFQNGYEQAEKETIERVISWVRKNAYIYTDTQNDEEGNLMTVFLEEAFTNDLKKAMEEE